MNRMSRCRRPAAIVLGAMAIGVLAELSAAPQTPSVEVILDRAAAYLDSYGEAVSGVVGEEQYLQRVASGVVKLGSGRDARERRMVSDIVFMSDPVEGWIEFRDVQFVNNQPVGQQQRVIELLTDPHPNAVLQARRLVELGSRYNLNFATGNGMAVVDRTINLPMSALLFLKRTHQTRSTFTLGRTQRIDGVNTVVVQFEEHATPRLIGSDGDRPATGQFWIEPETGTVVQSELKFSTGARSNETRATIRVRYARNERLGLTLPSWMDEEYETLADGDRLTLTCRATYTSYRRFGVAVDETFTEPSTQ